MGSFQKMVSVRGVASGAVLVILACVLFTIKSFPRQTAILQIQSLQDSKCPRYFSWIAQDLSPWDASGISQQDVLNTKPMAFFRIVIVDGKLYVERYLSCFQTREEYTVWGLLMLLENYPGQVPDVDMMFSCRDRPEILKSSHRNSPPPPLFSYCTTEDQHHDIVFPDWSFWGWPEVNIAPWPVEAKNIVFEAKALNWSERLPTAHWRGNLYTGSSRGEMIPCNSSSFIIQNQDWGNQKSRDSSSLSKQCLHRYKMYVEGVGWSVSLKYILLCGSTMLRIPPVYHDFYSRSLIPHVHFLPVNRNRMCESIHKWIDWGNNKSPGEAARIGECGQKFLTEELTLDYVYQYMLHLLQGYAKLLRFKPVPPPGLDPVNVRSRLLPLQELTIPDLSSNTRMCSIF